MRVRLLMLMTCIAMVLGGLVVVRPSGAQEGRREEYVQILQSLVQRQDTATMRGDVKALPGLYWTEEDGGRTALQNATDRLLYIKDWAKARAIRFERVVVHVRADALTVRSPSRVSINRRGLSPVRISSRGRRHEAGVVRARCLSPLCNP